MRRTKLVLETGRGTDRLSVRVIDEESRTMIVQFDLEPGDAEAMARADRPGWGVYSAHRQGGGYGRVQVTLRRWE